MQVNMYLSDVPRIHMQITRMLTENRWISFSVANQKHLHTHLH